MDTSKSTIYQHTRGKTLYLTIPSAMASDSSFPFKKGDIVTIEIKGKALEVKKKG